MRHYETISLVLGAGASREMGMPTSPEVVTAFDELMADPNSPVGDEERKLYRDIKRSLSDAESMDFETIFDRLNPDPGDPNARGTPEARGGLTRNLREHFAKLLLLRDKDPDNHYWKLDELAVYLGYALHVYSTNQDTGVEQSADPNRLVDGFWGRGIKYVWTKEIFPIKGTKPTICLHKLHGSVNWQWTPAGEFFSTDPSQEIDVTKAVLVLGHKEKVPSRLPYTFEHQKDIFYQVDADLIAVVGSSLRDPHVNQLLIWSLHRGADILLVTPEPPAALETFLEQARQALPDTDPSITPGRVLLLRKTAREFFMGLPGSLWLGTPIDGNDA